MRTLAETLFVVLSVVLLGACSRPPDAASLAGSWRAVAALPGGDLPFFIDVSSDASTHALDAQVRNGAERVPVERVQWEGGTLLLDFPAFDNRIELKSKSGALQGTLTLVKAGGREQVMQVAAKKGETYRFFPPGGGALIDVSGRWSVTFRDDEGIETPAVGEFKQEGDELTGTFLTPTGDHRYLAGQVRDRTLHLSTFDGAHAFLYRAEMDDAGTLAGDYWSGMAWHERWSAHRDDAAALTRLDELTYLKPGYDRFTFSFPDLHGAPVSLDDERFRGKVVIVVLAGSWCPNCHDEAAFLAPLYREKARRGLEIVSLMYEHFGDMPTAVRQTERMREKFGIQYTTLIAGTSDKDEASKTLPELNAVLAFPTTIFIDRHGRVRRIHTGFAGPGTGAHYDELTREIKALVDELLDEPT
jgi:thiol-disulfide isomerase/thioredoxin